MLPGQSIGPFDRLTLAIQRPLGSGREGDRSIEGAGMGRDWIEFHKDSNHVD